MKSKTRAQIVAEAHRIKNEIDQIFTDAAYWNGCVRKEGQPVIDPDPDGLLVRQRTALETMLAKEEARA